VAPLQLTPELTLWAVGRPAHDGHRAQRAEVPLRRTVAVEAPAHGQRRDLVDPRHLVHAAMAALTADPLPHVHGVIEVDVVREPIDPLPPDWPVRHEAIPDGRELRAPDPDLIVAVEAALGRRDTRVG